MKLPVCSQICTNQALLHYKTFINNTHAQRKREREREEREREREKRPTMGEPRMRRESREIYFDNDEVLTQLPFLHSRIVIY